MRTLSLDDAAVFLASTHNDRAALHRMLLNQPKQLHAIVSSLNTGRNKFQLDTEVNTLARTFIAMVLEELGRLKAGEPLTSELSTFDGDNLRDAQGRIVAATPYQHARAAAIELEIEIEDAKRQKAAAVREKKKQQAEQLEGGGSSISKATKVKKSRGVGKAHAINGQGPMKKQ